MDDETLQVRIQQCTNIYENTSYSHSQSLATQAMDRDANDPEKLDIVLRWLKKKFSEYRVDERRKVKFYH